jgi:hypothetical protein
MEVEIDLEVLREDRDGNDVVIYRFRPLGSVAGQHAEPAGASA